MVNLMVHKTSVVLIDTGFRPLVCQYTIIRFDHRTGKLVVRQMMDHAFPDEVNALSI